MPVYECYCPDCHTIFSFFSRRVDTDTRPACPRCRRPQLARRASLFAISKGRGQADTDDGAGLPAGVDEERMMRAFASMAGEMEHLDEADPKQAARLMRRLFDASGLEVSGGMAEAIRRVSIARGHDAREHALVVFGGAGGQHACEVARLIGMRRVVAHPLAGVLSAFGMGVAELACRFSAATA